jgi:hypothetical protein
MGKLTSLDIILGILYSTGAIMLIATAYMLYIRKYKRAKLEAMNAVRLVTSRDNIFVSKTKFLIESPLVCKVQVDLLDGKEKLIQTLFNEEITNGEYSFDFDPNQFEPGKYFLSLTTSNASILRGIQIRKT